MLAFFLQMFAFGGIALLALLLLGAVDHDGLSPDGHPDSPGSAAAGAAAALLSIRGLLAAITAAGALGALSLGVLRLPTPVGMLAAAGGAFLGFRSWRALIRRLRHFDRDHGASPELLLGREGVLTVGAEGSASPGIVQVTLGGLSQEYTAVPDGDVIFAEGARVVILRIESPSTVVVGPSPYPALPPNQ